MSDTSVPPEAPPADPMQLDNPPASPIRIMGQYIRDLSFETPNAPDIFAVLRTEAPEIPIGLDTNVRHLSGSSFEVTLSLQLEAVAAGKKAFGVSPSCFLTTRALEQIKNDVCYSNVPAVLVGISAGVSYGALGSTHHSLHDFAALRAINNITIIAPADNRETRAAVRHAAAAPRPVFLRFGKAAMPALPGTEQDLVVGRATTLREGSDVAFLATGETVVHALLAAGHLAEQGIQSRVLSLHTVKPLDTAAVLRAGRECRAVVTVEEHLVNGGLGEACATVLLQGGLKPRFACVGIPDEDTVTGAQADIFRHYGISMEGLAATVLRLRGTA